MASRRDFLLTTFPVAAQTRPAPAPVVFPQVAVGGGYTTELVVMAAGGPSKLILSFYGEDGIPLPVAK